MWVALESQDDMTVIPAYGVDYKSQKEVLAAYLAGKDFMIVSIGDTGRYINREDAVKYGAARLTIRFKQQRSVMVLDVAQVEARAAKNALKKREETGNA